MTVSPPLASDPGSSSASRMSVLVTAPFDEAVLEMLADFAEVRVVPVDEAGLDNTVDLLSMDLADVEVLVVEGAEVTEQVVRAAPKLRMVVACRANPVTVDVEACVRANVAVETTPARNADVTADLAFTLILNSVRQVPQSERWLRSGQWTEATKFYAYRTFRGPALNGRTLGVVGLGAVGSRVAERARGFGMTVLGHDPGPVQQAEFVARMELHEMLPLVDVLSLHVPLMPSTVGIFGAKEFSLMRAGSYFINSARAAVVDQQALEEALTSRHLAGAGLDVFHEEPLPESSVLRSLDHVVLTPHIGGASDDVVANHSRAALDAVRRLNGQPHSV